MQQNAELDQLEAQSEAIAAAQLPLVIALGLAITAIIGFVASAPLLGIIGMFGGLLVGPYAIIRAGDASGLSIVVKAPAIIAALVPGFALVAIAAVWWMSRQAASACTSGIERLHRAERLAARPKPAAAASAPAPRPAASAAASMASTPAPRPAPAPAPAPSSARSPVPESALPVVRGVLDRPADPATPIKFGLPQRPAGMSDEDWAKFENAVGPAARGTGHFLVVYRMDNGDNWLYVNEDVREQSGLTRDGLHRKAMQNLLAIVQRPNQLRRIENPPYMGFLLDGEHESSLVLIDDLWRQMIRMDCPNGVIVAIPTRDTCAFCDAGSPEGIIALREMIARLADAKGKVSDQLLRFDGEGWSIFR